MRTLTFIFNMKLNLAMINVYGYVALSGIRGETYTERRAIMSVGVLSLKPI